MLSPFELVAALDEVVRFARLIALFFSLSVVEVLVIQVPFPTSHYPMDYYSNDSLGPWTNNHESHRPLRAKRRQKVVVTGDEA